MVELKGDNYRRIFLDGNDGLEIIMGGLKMILYRIQGDGPHRNFSIKIQPIEQKNDLMLFEQTFVLHDNHGRHINKEKK